ncbi:MAG TPA: hypothetical protein VE046_06710 [Steroidobacteraceae bacterium]|nr:hypothetical protein [Steroidobacteraceae bacterium]
MTAQPPASSRLERLESLAVIEITGADAEVFLNGQLSNDVSGLLEGEQQLTSYNTPKGRVVAVLTLQREGDRLLAALPRELADALLERLRKYVMRAKVALRIAVELAAFGTPDQPARLRFDDASAHPSPVAAHEALEAWKRAAVAAGLPQIYAATSEQFVAQMLNLDLVDGVSFRKGCYTGQEIIARTQNLGRIKRRMLRFAVQGAPAVSPGTAVRLGSYGPGTVVESARTAAGDSELLAVVYLEPQTASGSDGAAGLDVRELPLPYAVRDR